MARVSAFATPEARTRYEQAYDRTLATAGVEVRARDIPTAFGATHVLEAGDAEKPPLVLLHTMSFSSTVWVRNFAALSQHHRVLAVDTIGDVNLSRSERTVKGRDDYVEWFTDVLAALDVSSSTAIAGNSYGGWLAANFALLRPGLVSSVVMISPPLLFTKYRPAFYAHIMSALFVRSEQKAERFARWFVTDATLSDESARLWLDQFSVGMPFFRGMNSFPRPKPFTDDELRSITAPVLLIEGEDEPMHDPNASIARATELLPSVTTTLVPSTKHVAELEQPERVNQLILDHVAGQK